VVGPLAEVAGNDERFYPERLPTILLSVLAGDDVDTVRALVLTERDPSSPRTRRCPTPRGT
jgi:hypothetical protein